MEKWVSWKLRSKILAACAVSESVNRILGAKNGGEQRIKMTREEIISMLSTELDEKWDNGITCLMVEDSDTYIPVIVHHKKDELIVEVEEQDKRIFRIGWSELNKRS